jgi:hypothetical protein
MLRALISGYSFYKYVCSCDTCCVCEDPLSSRVLRASEERMSTPLFIGTLCLYIDVVKLSKMSHLYSLLNLGDFVYISELKFQVWFLNFLYIKNKPILNYSLTPW